jgi:hypothetical protein
MLKQQTWPGGWSTEMCGDSTTNIEIAWNCTSKPPDTYGISPQEQLIAFMPDQL